MKIKIFLFSIFFPLIILPSVVKDLELSKLYFNKGKFNRHYKDFNQAYSDSSSFTDVEIHSHIVFTFNKKIDKSSIKKNSILLKRSSDGKIIKGKIALKNEYSVVFEPEYSYFKLKNGVYDIKNTTWRGLKPGYRYKIVLLGGKSGIKATDGTILKKNISRSFKTIDIDYGRYWFNSGFEAVKYVPGRRISKDFYDPEKPTIVFIHGWQPQYTALGKSDYRRDSFIFSDPGAGFNFTHIDMFDIWKKSEKNFDKKSWNIAVLYWSQLADDDIVPLWKPLSVEDKIWTAKGKNKMRYAVVNNEFIVTRPEFRDDNAPVKSFGEIGTDILKSALANSKNSHLRLLGHSLGGQAVLYISHLLRLDYKEGVITNSNILPERLVLLDPYWSGEQKSYFHNFETTSDASEFIIDELILFYDSELSERHFSIELHDTSEVTDGKSFFISMGDESPDIRKKVAVVYHHFEWYEKVSLFYSIFMQPTYQRHLHSFYNYLWSYSFPPPKSGISASTPGPMVKKNMNYYQKHHIKFVQTDGRHRKTPTPKDNLFRKEQGS